MKTSFLITLVLALFSSGCSVLFGNVKPPAEKSDDYKVFSLDEFNSDWIRIPPEQELGEEQKSENETPNQISDVAFQSKSTASVISLNTSCRGTHSVRPGLSAEGELKEVSKQLFLGIQSTTLPVERIIEVSGSRALDTTLSGRMGQEPMKMRAVVLRKGTCLYDLMYIARPDSFERQETDFNRFVGEFKVN